MVSDTKFSNDCKRTQELYQEASRRDFLSFMGGLVIPGAHGPRPFKSIIAPFQMEGFEQLAPSLHAIRDGTMPPIRRFWFERTKKASKDSDIAVCLLWLMAFCERPILAQVCASNNKQARIIEDRAVVLVSENPWLNDRVEIVQSNIRSKYKPREIRTQIEATGTAGAAQGPTPDLLVLNELVHVDRWSVMEAHMNNADGVPRGVAIVSTNAGIKGTKAEVWRKNAFSSNRWCVQVFSKMAPWLDEEDVEEAKRRDVVGSEFNRLYRGLWISGRGDAVDDKSIDRCFRVDGPLLAPEPGWVYIAGLDLGISHDHSGLVVVGINRVEQRIRVVLIKAWEPVMEVEDRLEVDLQDVEDSCFEVYQTFRPSWIGYDPAAGGSYMAQRLRRRGVPMNQMTFVIKNLTAMAVAFVQSVKDGKLECYDDPDGRLRRDFGKFNIEHRPPSGYKLIAVSDEYGHADVGTALVICLPKAVELLGGWGGLQEDEKLVFDEDGELDDDEVEAMPDGLRDIYEMDREEDGRHLMKQAKRRRDLFGD